MAAPRFRTRFVHATIVDVVTAALAELGWTAPTGTEAINFGATAVRVLDYQPDERGERITLNTVAITVGDVPDALDEELGASHGGLRSMSYPVFCDIYMEEQALSVAVADDLRDVFTDAVYPLHDKINGGAVPGALLRVEEIIGPERPPAANTNESFKRFWRVLRVGVVLYFSGG